MNDNEHIVEFNATGYGLQHPLSCRPNLLDCEYNVYLASLDEPELEPGRYTMYLNDNGWPSYARMLDE
jgi:hypothetical protein